MMLHFCEEWISIHSAWKASFDVFSVTVYFRDSLTYKPTPPEARGVGAHSKIYPGMFGLKSKFFPQIILVSETLIMLKSQFNSSNKWTWKFSRFRLRLLTLLCRTETHESLVRLAMWRVVTALDTIVTKIIIIKIKGFSCIEPKKNKIVNTSKLFQILFGRQMRRYAVIKLAMS